MPGYKQKKQRLKQLVKQEQQERVQKIKQQGHTFIDTDEFKKSQKQYKFYQHLQTDFSQLLQLQSLKSFMIDDYKVYEIQQPQGAFLIKNFISPKQQIQIGFQALNQYIFRPYRTNLDGTNGLYHQNNKQQNTVQNNQIKINQLLLDKGIQERQSQQEGNVCPINPIAQNKKILQQIAWEQSPQYYFNQKIRMSNLGYQYDWPHRCYPSTSVAIPSSIVSLTKRASHLYSILSKQSISYYGEAVIVNYYKLKDYMTGHLDDGEEDQQNPIFSFCFGLSCVFLLGARTRQAKPLAINLDAGDLLIMASQSRKCYHGVPRVIQHSYHQFDIKQENDVRNQIQKQILQKKIQLKDAQNIQKRYLNGYDQIENYFKSHRININVRQVWVRNQDKKVIGQIQQKTEHINLNQ